MSGSEDEQGSILAGFLFGNIDEDGRLENDILDEEAKDHVAQLASLGVVGNLVKDFNDRSSDDSSFNSNTNDKDYHQKALDCVDYSTIDELAEEQPEIVTSGKHLNFAKNFQSQSDDYDDHYDDEQPSTSSSSRAANIGILPSIVPKAETMKLEQQDGLGDLFSPSSPRKSAKTFEGSQVTDSKTPVMNQIHHTEEAQIEEAPPVTGLASLEGKTVIDLFPDFRPGKVLRFSRLFGPKKYVSAQWKGLKRKKRKRKLLGLEPTVKATGFDLRFAPPPKPEDCEPNQLITHLQPIPLHAYGDQYKYLQVKEEDSKEIVKAEEMNAEWLLGPAAYWYELNHDKIEAGTFQYGFKEKSEQQKKEEDANASKIVLPSDDHFNLVCLTRWEDEIIWSNEEPKPKDNSAAIRKLAGWIPSGNVRTMQAYLSQFANKDKASTDSIVCSNMLKNLTNPTGPKLNKDPNSHKLSDWYSLFPVENSKLVYEKWEDKIIWDNEAVDTMPKPEVFKLDPNDENLILSLPEDVEAKQQSEQEEQLTKKEYKSKSRFMNKKNQDQTEEETLVRSTPKDMFNLSNDEYYMPKQDRAENKLQADLSSLCIQHSTPAVELRRPFFPTHFAPAELRLFHRTQLSKKKLSVKNKHGGFHVVHSLHKRIRKKAKEREKERQAFGGGEMFFMRQPHDLSAMDGVLVFMEYCEERPPLLSQAGMNTRIRNYHRRKHGKDANAPTLEYGEISFVHHSPFLGQLGQGQVMQALENNLCRAPLYPHKTYSCDFLLLKTTQGYYVRNVKDIFTVGQLCPKYEVPGPNSKRANNHIRDFLQIFIYRLFWKSPDTPRRIKMDDIRKALPKHSESSVRKRLKLCADFRRTGVDCNWWVLKQDFRLPSEEEMRAMVTPEQTCAYYIMLAAEQRLKDAGFGEKSLFAPDDDDNEDDAKKIDDEIQTAPWNTTRAFIQAMKGKCLLQVTGVADPTGCGEGFSYVRVPNKPITKDETEEQKQSKKQKLVTGTDADLRRLNLKQARLLLKDFGVSQEEIQKLSRWEVIDKVRTMSTQAAKQGTTEVAMNKFARGSRFTVAEHQEKYKDECQRIFDLQNKVLSSDAILSTDEESSGEEGSDIEDLGKDLESMLSNKKMSSEEHEEAERRELQKLLSQDKIEKDQSRPSSATFSRPGSSLDKLRGDAEDSMNGYEAHAGRRLVISRTFREGGREFVRTETVKNQFVIDAYLRIVTREKNYREVFASQDEKHKEDMRRERRRIQEQLRRIKRNEERERLRQLQQRMNGEGGESIVQPTPEDQAKIDALSDKPTKSLKCGACGAYGHMKTNKMCPKYTEVSSYHTTDDELNTEEMSNIAQDDLIKVEGTKITLGRALIEAHEDMKRKSLMIRIPKENVIPVTPPPPTKKKRRPPSTTQTNADYLVRHHKSKNRRRTNPVVALNVLLEQVVTKLKEIPDSWPFHAPVSSKVVPDYYQVIKNPMDLQTIRENIKKGMYHARDDILEHVSLIHSNCVLYNGQHHPLTKVAESLVNTANDQLNSKGKEFTEIEREINPLLDDDPQVGFSWLCENILSSLKAMPESWPFHQPVPVKIVPDYYDIIKDPMDLETLKTRCQEQMYQTRDNFAQDVHLLYSNSLAYNGAEHTFTKTANKMMTKFQGLLEENAEKFAQLETDIINQPDDEITSTNPPSVAQSDVIEEEHYTFDQEAFNNAALQQLSHNVEKQVVTAGNEDEFVDIEGEGALLSYTQQQSYHGGVQYEQQDFEQQQGFENMNFDQNVYSGEYEGQQEFPDFQSELYNETYSTDEQQSSQPESGENIDLGLLLLQDLVHSDEDDEDSDDDIPLDDGDEEIPLDDGEEEFEMEEESRDRTAVSGSGDEEVSGGVNTEEIEHDEEEDEEFLDVEMNEKSW